MPAREPRPCARNRIGALVRSANPARSRSCVRPSEGRYTALTMAAPRTPASAFVARRRALMTAFPGPVLLAAGLPRSRNYRANRYPFRAASHFLYFVGDHIPGAALLFAGGAATLFAEPPEPDDALWHGPRPSFSELRDALGLDDVRPLADLDAALRKASAPVATLPTNDAQSSAWLTARLGRVVEPCSGPALAAGTPDAALADAMIALRLEHDAAAVDQLRAIGALSAGAHIAGMRATRGARTEAEIAGAMLGELRRHGLEDAYGPIVTVHGEVLHNETHKNPIAPGDLLLADVGGETPEGWAGDITRVWPVSGRFSPTQRAIYDVVLAAQKACVAKVRPGVRYRDIHETAKRIIVEGLRDLGIFRGDVDGLLERGAAAIFFPHGIGHLLGLDVHDMEDLGDRAGYAPGRTRSSRFGDAYLRMDRDLAPGMAVTIEPGFYQVPAILADDAITGPVGADLVRDVLAKYADVRGIRIEDDVLCTDDEPEVLTRSVPKEAAAVEEIMAAV
ncbi:Xaa-Pro aminopeptidase [Minicystis rosea]|nr:Xaa-Pro aminopeptidase [Minicystis rosea]